MSDAATETEEIIVPEEEAREEAPPDWLTDSSKIGVIPGEATKSSAEVESGAGAETGEILTELVGSIHDKLADATGYAGWRLTEGDIRLWSKVLKFLLRKMPSKDWPIAIAVVSLAISESLKFVGFIRFKRTNAIQTPTRAPEAANGD